MRKLVAIVVVVIGLLTSLGSVEALEPTGANHPFLPPPKGRPVEQRLDNLASREADIRGRLDTRRENIASMVANLKDKWASREAAFKDEIAKFRDKAKADRVSQINSTLKTINDSRTKILKSTLDRLSQILDTIETRVNEAGSSGKDIDSAKSAIATARTAIQTAQTAVDVQAGKDYTIQVTSETTVKADAQTARDSLYNDLKATQTLIIQSRSAVEEAYKAAKEAIGLNSSPAASV